MTKQEIRDLMRFFDKSDISKVKIKNGDFSIELQKGFDSADFVNTSAQVQNAPAQTAQAPAPVQAQEQSSADCPKKDTINSPMVGTYYEAPAPGAEPFVKVGSTVKKGDPIGIIEAMKIMNEIEAEFDCRIVEKLVDDGQPVEFDMPIFAVEKV